MKRIKSSVAANWIPELPTWSLVPIAATLCAAVTLIALFRVRSVQFQTAAADANYTRLVQDVSELRDLRAKVDGSRLGQRPAQDTLTRIYAVMETAGLSPSRLRDLASESDGPLPGSNQASQRVQAMRLTLEAIRPTELRTFLDHWRSPSNPWLIKYLELSHAGPPDDQNDHYNAKLVVAAAYRLDHRDSPETQATPR